MHASLLLITTLLVSIVSLLGVWVILGVVRDIVTEHVERHEPDRHRHGISRERRPAIVATGTRS